MNTEGYILDLVVGELLKSQVIDSINGDVYRKKRPTQKVSDVQKEDIVLTFVGGASSQFQTDIVKLSLFIPNINTMPNETRFEELTKMIIELFDKKSFGSHRFVITETPTIHPIIDNSIDASFCTVFIRVTTTNF